MTDILAQLSRIIARYIAMYLMTVGFIAPEAAPVLANDPQLLGLIGAILASITEALWAMAVKRGWAK